MANVVVFDPEFTGMFSTIEEETIEERISCFRRLRNAKHHKVITLNDLIKMFGYSECAAGNLIEIDELLGLDVVNYVGVSDGDWSVTNLPINLLLWPINITAIMLDIYQSMEEYLIGNGYKPLN